MQVSLIENTVGIYTQDQPINAIGVNIHCCDSHAKHEHKMHMQNAGMLVLNVVVVVRICTANNTGQEKFASA
jgi:hypothetical protein